MYNAYGHKKVKILYSSVVDITKSDGPGVNEREFIFFIKDNKDLDATFLINEKNRNEFNDDSKILYFSYYYNVLSILWYQLKYIFKLSVTIVKLNPEIVILRLPPIPIWFALFFLVNWKCKFHIKTQGTIGSRSYKGKRITHNTLKYIFSFLKYYLFRIILKLLDIIDACTPQIAQNLREVLSRSDILVVENGVNSQKFVTNVRIFEKETLKIGYIGGLPEERGDIK